MISDSDILRLIELGLIFESRFVEGQIHKWHGAWRRFHILSEQYHPLSGRGRYMIRVRGDQRLIYSNKLLWMIRNRRLVPLKHDVDHVNNDRRDNGRVNLRSIPRSENRREGFEIQMEKGLQSWREFFDFIEFMGRPPVEGHPLWE